MVPRTASREDRLTPRVQEAVAAILKKVTPRPGQATYVWELNSDREMTIEAVKAKRRSEVREALPPFIVIHHHLRQVSPVGGKAAEPLTAPNIEKLRPALDKL